MYFREMTYLLRFIFMEYVNDHNDKIIIIVYT